MADLEKLLLEAAGRTGPSRRNRHSPPSPRRRRGGSYSDNESDSDDLHDSRGYASRKHSTSHVPLKKRLDSSGRDDEHSIREDGDGFDRKGDSDDDSIGSDLYKDEDDRRKLAQMTELEREMILSERSTKITDKKMQEKLRKQKEKMNQSRKDSHPHISSRTSVRTSARSSDKATAKDDALNELRAKRMRQKDPDTHQRFGDLTKGGSGSHRYSPVKRRSFPAKAASSSSQSRSGSQSEDDESSDDGGIGDSEDDKSSPESTVLTYDDIKEITIQRSKLAKWLMEPFFDDLIVGCFVRVAIMSKTGPTYRLWVVRNVESEYSGKQYKLDDKMTHKYLNAVWGNESSADRLQMDRVSNFPPTEMEFEQWVKEVKRNVGRMPSKQDVLDKKDAIQKTSTYVYSAATVKQMVQEKKSATSSSRPLNVLAEKDRLRREMEVALGKNDGAEVERIKARLSELEASRQTQEKDTKAVMLAEMNRKNRVENFRNASGMKSTIGLKAGDAGYDPFSRRWTRSRNYYVPKAGGGVEAAVTENGDQTAELVGPDVGGPDVSGPYVGGAVSTAAALEAAADAGKLVDTSAPVDQGTESNMLHNFELPISLATLQKFGGAQGAQAGFMARKQRIEATIGCQVPENDGRRHGLTLTVSDYKRRRGLL